jgi:ribose transport system ATP-binding protein
MRLGIATIYQELDLVEDLSVAENIFLGHEPATAGFVVRARAARRTAPICWPGSATRRSIPRRLVGELSAAGSRSCPWPGRSPTTYG